MAHWYRAGTIGAPRGSAPFRLVLTRISPPLPPFDNPFPRSVRKLVDKYARFIHLDQARTTLLMSSIGSFAAKRDADAQASGTRR
jgi:hypothetical protein